MNHAVPICLVFPLLFNAFGEAVACGENPVVTLVGGPIRSDKATTTTRRGLFVPLDRLRKAPIWSPGQGDVPLSISDAHDLALNWAKQQVPANFDLEVARISLGPCRELDTWYYVVLFDFADITTVAVLFDGTLIGLTNID